MKKTLSLLITGVTALCSMESSAQEKYEVWLNGQYTIYDNIDSIVFVSQAVGDPNRIDGYEYVDLGLPSAKLWATCNVGASKPEEYGDYFAWGEVTPKETYEAANYKWSDDSCKTYTKYGVNGKDGTCLRTLLAEDDAATANWGENWRMPTLDEQNELYESCYWNHLKGGLKGTSKINGNTIFFPSENTYDTRIMYYSSTIYIFTESAYVFNTQGTNGEFISRLSGCSVRAIANILNYQANPKQTIIAVWHNGVCAQYEKIDSISVVDPTVSIIDGNEYVDLGLPSGTKWATYNVGASNQSECGDYFAWGETSPKKKYRRENYKFSEDSCETYTKYVINSDYGIVDSLTTLLAEDDAATQNWGSSWRLPTSTEQKELIEGCLWNWTYNYVNQVPGYVGTSKTNGNKIFLPAAGYYTTDYKSIWFHGTYMSSSLYLSSPKWISSIKFGTDYISAGRDDCRDIGSSVRAVAK